MKNYIKFLFLMAAFLFLVSVSVLVVNAEDGESMETDGQKNYKGHVTYSFTHSDGSYSKYDRIEFSFSGDSPFYLVYLHHDDGGIIPYLFCGSLENLDVSAVSGPDGIIYGSKSYSRSAVLYDTEGSGSTSSMWVDHVGFDSASPRYLITADIPVFYTVESLKNYLETGDESGWLNRPGFEEDNNATYDESLGYLQGLDIETLDYYECHGSVDYFSNCFQLSWEIPQYDRNKYQEFCEFKFDMQYSYMTPSLTKRAFGSCLLDYKSNSFVDVTEGTHIFCAHTFYSLINLDGNVTSFNIQDVKKIYVRLSRVDCISGEITYGDWAVYDVNFREGFFTNNRVIGGADIYPGDSEIGSDGSIGGEPIQTIPSSNSGDNGFSFAGIDLTDVVNIGKYFIGLVESLINMIGQFPSLFNRIFLFLPAEIRTMIYMFFVILVVSGLLKIFV